MVYENDPDDADDQYSPFGGGYNCHNDDQEFEGIHYIRKNRDPTGCKVVIIDTQGIWVPVEKRPYGSGHLTSTRGCKSLYWRVT